MLLRSKFPMGEEITSEAAQKEFIRLFGKILRLRNILRAFDQFEGYDIMTERELQDYQSLYIDLYEDWKPRGKERKISTTISSLKWNWCARWKSISTTS